MSDIESLNIGKKRGSLTTYIGYSLGASKTLEMLLNTTGLFQGNVDTKLGYIEPYRRGETNASAEQLPKIVTNFARHGSHHFQYLDVDRIIEESPTIILTGELAHASISRDRHEKRYMGIEEVLDHGIDVHTTLNIQRIESLNSQVELVTGVYVKERIPNYFIMSANALEVVDISPEQLIKHLKTGEVYKKGRLDVAFSSFFTYTHLSKLYTLTLRTVADLMSGKEKVRHNHKTSPKSHIAVAVSGSIYNEVVIKEALHVAQKEYTKLTVIYIDVLEKSRQYKDGQKQVYQHPMLTKSLGVKVKVAYNQTVVLGLDEWCRNQDVTKSIIGQHIRNKRRDSFNKSLIDHLVSFEHNYKIEIAPIKQTPVELRMNKSPYCPKGRRFVTNMSKVILIQVVCIMMGLWIYQLDKHESNTIVLMVSLISIILLSVWMWLYIIGFLAAIINVFAFNHLFTEPRYTLEIYRLDYPATLIVSISTGILTNTLLKQIKFQYTITKKQPHRTDLLFQSNDSIK